MIKVPESGKRHRLKSSKLLLKKKLLQSLMKKKLHHKYRSTDPSL